MTKKSNYKIELRKKKIFSIPYNTQIFSMFAIILIIGAPALISIIDDSYTYEGVSETQLLDVTDDYSFIRITNEEGSETADTSYIPASENDGIFVIALNDPSDIDKVRFARISGIDIAPLMSGAGNVKIITSSDLSSISLITQGEDNNIVVSFIQSEVDPTVWTASLSSLDLIKLKSGAYDFMYVQMYGPNEIYDMEIFAVGEYVIPYGEIIIGMTGGLLLICALFATPWFDVDGLNIKKKRRA